MSKSKRTEKELVYQKEFSDILINTAQVIILIIDVGGRIIRFNPYLEEISGYRLDEVKGKDWFTVFIPERERDKVRALFLGAVNDIQTRGNVNYIVTKDGRERLVEWYDKTSKDENGKTLGLISIGQDITERKAAEDRVVYLNRMYATLSQVNQVIVRTKERESLFREICSIAVEAGKFRFAWIGLVNRENQSVVPAAQAGVPEDCLSHVQVTAKDEPLGQSPIGVAIRTGKASVCNDFLHDPNIKPWYEAVIKAGYGSSAAAPIWFQGSVIGALSVYAGEPNFFDTQATELLEEVGVDISFALNNIEREKQRQRAEAALRESEERYRVLVEGIPDVVCLLDRDSRIVYVNSFRPGWFGPKVKSVLGMRQEDLFEPEVARRHRRILTEVFETPGKIVDVGPVRLLGLDIWVEVRLMSIADDEGEVTAVISVVRDVTGRKKAEEEIVKGVEKLKMILDGTVKALASTIEKRDPYTSGHQTRVAKLACAIAEDLGLPPGQVNIIRMSALLHDIGKINIPSEILGKPGKLSEVEMDLVRTHSESGYDIVKTIPFDAPVARIILQHHERMDGSGYPAGLLADETMLEAKIIAVADTVEAMSSHRPYRPALGIDKALAEISANKGVLYEPAVVESCLKIFAGQQFYFD